MNNSMKIKDYIVKQRSEVASAFNRPAYYPIGIKNPEVFPSFLERTHDIELDPRVRNKKAFIRNISGLDQSEYWVHISYTGYRKSYFRYLEETFGICRQDLTSDWHADHMLGRGFAKKFGVDYVRMCLLHKSQNTSYGRKFEKNMLKQKQNKRHIFLMDYLCAMKVLNIKIPLNKNDYEQRKSEIAQSLADEGVVFFDNRGGEHSLDEYFKWWDIV